MQVHALINGCLCHKQSLAYPPRYTTMIRKNSLLCKLNRINILSKYGHSSIDLKTGKKTKKELCILRVFCKSCGHAHAVLPDLIIPYSSYSLFFILHVLGQYFAQISSIEQICECSGISVNRFFKWLSLWKAHKQT